MSAHFSWEEMTATSHADIQAQNRREAETWRANIEGTMLLLEQVRAILGVGIHVNSGFRGPSLNAAVGGSKTSQHMRGEAADIVPGGRLSLDQAFAVLASAVDQRELRVGQLLKEKSWIHISNRGTRPPALCGEIGHQDASGRVVIDRRVA